MFNVKKNKRIRRLRLQIHKLFKSWMRFRDRRSRRRIKWESGNKQQYAYTHRASEQAMHTPVAYRSTTRQLINVCTYIHFVVSDLFLLLLFFLFSLCLSPNRSVFKLWSRNMVKIMNQCHVILRSIRCKRHQPYLRNVSHYSRDSRHYKNTNTKDGMHSTKEKNHCYNKNTHTQHVLSFFNQRAYYFIKT